METHSPVLNPKAVRRLVAIVSVTCVAGMIISAALKHLGGVISFGCLSTGAIVTLMAVIASQPQSRSTPDILALVDTDQALVVETLAIETISEGASEPTVRSLIGAAVALGRTFSSSE